MDPRLIGALALCWASQAPDAQPAPEPEDPDPEAETALAPAEEGGEAAQEVAFRYLVQFRPAERVAKVRLRVEQRAPGLKRLRFHIDPAQHLDFRGDGDLEREDDSHVVWRPPEGGGTARWSARLDHLRDQKSYDARLTSRWALFRGSDLVPPAASRFVGGSTSVGTVRFELPKRWKLVTPAVEIGPGRYRIDTDRFFARPQGWMMAGRLRTVVFESAGVQVTVATPRKLGLELMELRTFLRFTLPSFRELLGEMPDRIVIVGAGDPMWRGGLSGPRSLYVHADRPLVSKDGTSPILHELMHAFMRAVSKENGDWVVEGLAELYAVHLLHRAGGMSDAERDAAIAYLRKKGRGVRSLLAPRSTGRRTAKAVGVLDRLDRKIREHSGGETSLDHVVRRLVESGAPITTAHFRKVVSDVVGEDLAPFFETHVAATP